MTVVGYCEHCRKELEDYGSPAKSLYESCCKYYILHHEYAEIFIRAEESFEGEIIALLERKGFILSTESGLDYVKIKPLGYEPLSSTAHFFCINPFLHHT